MVDKRARSKKPIAAVAPLPYVSRKALRRVKDVYPIATECPYCQGPVKIVTNDALYGRQYGDWPYVYLCLDCSATVGLHPNTDLPLGMLANAELRDARRGGKNYFIMLQTQQKWTRGQAYAWLATELGIDRSCCHWAWFDLPSCLRAAGICRSKVLNREQ